MKDLSLAKNLIAECKKTKSTTLDLGNCGIENLNDLPELFECEWLEELILGSEWKEYSESEKKLVDKKSSNLVSNRNKISSISSNFGNLKNLNKLVCSELKLKDIQGLSSLKKLTYLDLRKNFLKDVFPLGNMTSLVILYLSNNKISNIDCLKRLTNLEHLDLNENKISDVSALSDLTSLSNLSLANNRIKNASFLANLTNLEYISLVKNLIEDYNFLSLFKNLKNLDLQYMNIQNIVFVTQLKGLESLNLSNNKITDVSAIEELENLTILSLGSNQITDISKLKKLKRLKVLNLNANQISDISVVKHLTELNNLGIGFNLISDISPIAYLNKLTILNLAKNKISDIEPLKVLVGLRSLHLSSNQITSLNKDFFCVFPNLTNFNIKDNPIVSIPSEIINKENPIIDIKNYWNDIEKTGKIQNKEVKIIFIGNGNVGKTQIAKRLVEKEKFVFNEQHDSTHAIVLLQMELADLILNIWDFAGQDIYHATHRLFMQTNALFLLVWDFENENRPYHTWRKKKYENEEIKYWLGYANCFAEDSPILILQNKCDNSKHKEIIKKDQDSYKKKYLTIIDFLRIIAKKGRGFRLLEDRLEKIFKENPFFKNVIFEELPKSWFDIRNDVRNLQNQGIKDISIEDFKAICENYKIDSTWTILDFLHNTGNLYYRKGYFSDRIIVNQAWVIEAVYKILDRADNGYIEIIQHQKGELYYRNLCKIWNNYTDKERELFMEFMLSAELAFEIRQQEKAPLQERVFVVPQLLPMEKPKDVLFYYKNRYELKTKQEDVSYSFLPKILIYRFIVRTMQPNKIFSKMDYIWSGGILLESEEGIAMVEAEYENKVIKISAQNDEILSLIKEELNHIQNEGKLKAEKRYETTLTEEFWKGGLKKLTPLSTILDSNLKQTTIMSKIPQKFITALEQQVSEQYENIVRLNKLKSYELKKEKRQEYQDEIDRCDLNIEETEEMIFKKIKKEQPQINENEIRAEIRELRNFVERKIDFIHADLKTAISQLNFNFPAETLENLKAEIDFLQQENKEGVLALANFILDMADNQENTDKELAKIIPLIKGIKGEDALALKLKLALPIAQEYFPDAKIEGELELKPSLAIKQIWEKLKSWKKGKK